MEDKRVRKTKIAIKKAFQQLLEIKNYEDITIQDISDIANITRRTFYNNYSGLHELIQEMENEAISVVKNFIETTDFKNDIYKPDIINEKVTDFLISEYQIYGKILANKNNYKYIVKFLKLTLNTFKQAIMEEYKLADENTVSLCLSFLINGFLSAYQEYNNEDTQMNLKTFTRTLNALTFNGIYGVMNLKRD